MRRKLIIGVTMGDPAGIGPEVVVKGIATKKIRMTCIPVVFGSYEVIRRAAKRYVKNAKVEKVSSFENFAKHSSKKTSSELINVYPCTSLNYKKIKVGKLNYTSAKLAVDSLICATKMALSKKIDALVTAPLTKKGLFLAGYKFKGHTEFLAKLSHTKNYAMMFVSPDLKVALVTTHLPISEVSRALTPKKVREKIELTNQMLKKAFSIKNPKIAVCGLNPHAGEETLLGEEDRKIILPAIRKAQRKGLKVFGPVPADSVFSPDVSSNFDCIVAMYHDQGIIPLKTKGIGNAVNLTWGLPFIRTSPDHGTAFNIAGKGKANPAGIINAVLLASKLTRKLKI